MSDLTTTTGVFVQWKNIEVCLDFSCICSPDELALEFHLDGFCFGCFKCPRCARVWRLDQPTATEIPDPGFDVMMLEEDEDDE